MVSYRLLYPSLGSSLFAAPALNHEAAGVHPQWPSVPSFPGAGGLPETAAASAEGLCGGRFEFLNLPARDLGRPVRWTGIEGADPLWEYCLHCGEWALSLAAAYRITAEARFGEALVRLLGDWVENNPPGSRPGWEPYPISRRLVAWGRVAITMGRDAGWEELWERRLAPSMWRQARFLEANLEKDLANNHLMGNFRALAWVGLLFPRWPRARRWLEMGLGGLWAEMRRQVLSDGVHDERGISYHTMVLQDLLETWQLCRLTGQAVPEDVPHTLMRMLQFLADMQAPDGSYPMLNDTVPGYPMDPRGLLLAGSTLLGQSRWVALAAGGDRRYATWLTGTAPQSMYDPRGGDHGPTLAVYPEAGYVIFRKENRESLWFDGGPMGPEHLPGHGHADALSLAWFAGGRWLLVDPGVFGYFAPGPRDRLRSTASHNTVSVDGRDQCVFWGPFRVAYPPKVRLLGWSKDEAAGEHYGYARLGEPVVHRRSVRRLGPGAWEIHDRFEGRGRHEFLFALQLAPGAVAQAEEAGCEALWPEGARLRIHCAGPPAGARPAVEPGCVSLGWNLEEVAPRFVLRWRSQVPCESRARLELMAG